MAIIHYCDGCGDALAERDHYRAKFKKEFDKRSPSGKRRTTVEVEIVRGVDGTWNGGDVCRKCLLSVIADGHELLRQPLENTRPVVDDDC